MNRGGNRQANAALYRAMIVRMRWHPPTIAYVERRTTEGLSKRDIIRCLQALPGAGALWAPAVPEPGEGSCVRRVEALDLYRSINALAESGISLHESALIFNRGPWRTVEDVKLATLAWVHWWDTSRLNSAIGIVPPAESEAAHNTQSQPANETGVHLRASTVPGAVQFDGVSTATDFSP